MIGERLCSDKSLEVHILLYFQVQKLYLPFICLKSIVLNVGWKTDIFWKPSKPSKYFYEKNNSDQMFAVFLFSLYFWNNTNITVLVWKFACFNLISNIEASNLLNSGVLMYLAWSNFSNCFIKGSSSHLTTNSRYFYQHL